MEPNTASAQTTIILIHFDLFSFHVAIAKDIRLQLEIVLCISEVYAFSVNFIELNYKKINVVE